MAKRLNDRGKKQIIADYAQLGSYAATARKHKVSVDTVRRVCLADPQTHEIVSRKKEANTADVLAYMDGKVGAFKLLGDYVFDERLNPAVNRQELSALPLDKLMQVFGIATDKLLKGREIAGKMGAEKEDGDIIFEVVGAEGRAWPPQQTGEPAAPRGAEGHPSGRSDQPERAAGGALGPSDGQERGDGDGGGG